MLSYSGVTLSRVKDMLNVKIYYNDIHVLYNNTSWNHCTMPDDLIISGGVYL